MDEDGSVEDVTIEEEYEIEQIEDTISCISAVEELERPKSPVVVCCYGQTRSADGKIQKIVCAKDRKVYVFHVYKHGVDLIRIGKLEKLLTSKELTKIFHGSDIQSKMLFEQFQIILDGSEVFDTKVALQHFKDNKEEKLSDLLKIGFTSSKAGDLPCDFTNENQNEEKERYKVILAAFRVMSSWETDKRDLKKKIFEAVNSLMDKELFTQAKGEKKKKLKTAKQSQPKAKKKRNK